jgi:hypothetical protein
MQQLRIYATNNTVQIVSPILLVAIVSERVAVDSGWNSRVHGRPVK